MNNAQNKALHALLHKTGLTAQKETIVSSFSHGRTSSSRQLSHLESVALIQWLQAQQPAEPDEGKKMRGKILSIAHDMGMVKLNKAGKRVADMQRVDAWMLKYSYLHKKLDAYKYAELPKLVTQFEKVFEHFVENF